MNNLEPKNETALVSKPTVLVAGGAGFVGSFVCQALLFQGCRVIAVDNLVSGKKDNLSHCFGMTDFVFLEHDLTQGLEIDGEVDYIFHLAGMEWRGEATEKVLKVNDLGTKNLLSLAEEKKARLLIGSTLNLPDQKPTTPLTKEARSKHLINARSTAEKIGLELAGKVDVRIVRMPSVYGPRMDLEGLAEVNQVFKSFIAKKKIKLPANKLIRPLYISDAVFGLLKLMFSAQLINERMVVLAGGDEVSVFDFYHQAAKAIGQEGRAGFFEIKESVEVVEPNQLKGWQPQIKLGKGIKETVSSFFPATQSEEKQTGEAIVQEAVVVTPEVGFEKTDKQKEIKTSHFSAKQTRGSEKRWRGLLVGSLAVLLIVGLPFYPLLVKWGWLGWQLRGSVKALGRADYQGWEEKAQSAYLYSFKVESEFERLADLFNLSGGETGFWANEGWWWRQLAGFNFELSRLVGGGLGDGKVEIQSDKVEKSLEQLWWRLGDVESWLDQGKDRSLAVGLIEKKLGVELSSTLVAGWREDVYRFKQISPYLTQLLGFEGERNYLALFQNNMELRPTGGFIGSFGLIKFNGEQKVEWEVLDVYDADGQLKGHIDPPEPIEEYLGEASWFLRDSNWDPNFPTSAVRATWFLEKSLGRSVDGVVGLNIDLVKRLVTKLGGVWLVDYDEIVTADNLYQLAQAAAEEDFFPGSKGKKSFLADLLTAIQLRLEEGSWRDYLAVVEAVRESLIAKDLFIFDSENQIQERLVDFGWAGEVRKPGCFWQADCLADYLMLVEANLGVNKANFYLDREINLMINKGADKIKHNLLVGYRNRASEGDLYGGDYKNYFRLYLPLGSVLDEARIGGQKVEVVDEQISSGKMVYGFLIEVPVGEEVLVEVDWDLERPANLGEYLLYLQRQSGAHQSPLTVSLGEGLVAGAPTKIFNLVENETGWQYQGEFESDLVFDLSLE